MKTIKIEVNQAKIVSYSVALADEKPSVTATIALLCGHKEISTFSLSTKSWNDVTFDLPPEMIGPIVKIAEQLEAILVRECTTTLGQIAYKEKS